ncbi:Alpha/Beta hydrolase protein [Infundibulicybe gibba]|nr:Alpha/Beta hydrolase protein [Infundibulicybe gibba]
MLTWGTLLAVLASALLAQAAPPLTTQRGISILTPTQVARFKPYSFYAGAAYCKPSKTKIWKCGPDCDFNSRFKPVASGGDGALVQYWYVGYDPALKTVIVAYQVTTATIRQLGHVLHLSLGQFFGFRHSKGDIPFLTNAILRLDELDKSLFPEISSAMKIHDGFGEAQERHSVLAAVKTAFNEYSTKKVTLVGHSLGGAIALISSVYLKLYLPVGTIVNTVTYSMPRVGNQEFADYVDANLNLTRINNKRDPIPITPGRLFGFRHPKGERYIQSSGSWVVCPGQDDARKQCIRGSVSNIFISNIRDHNGMLYKRIYQSQPDQEIGPFDGVRIDC